MDNRDLITITTKIAASYVSNNRVTVAEVPILIGYISEAFSKFGRPAVAIEPDPEPAVAVRSSVKADYIVCLEDGKKLKMLKRYLQINYDMTPDEYRAKWKLPPDYPMVAPSYSERRRQLANEIGLGHQPKGRAKRKTR